MEIREHLQKHDTPLSKERDIRKEAERMIQRQIRHLSLLREQVPRSQYLAKARETTAQFALQLRNFLSRNGAQGLFEELLGFVMGNVSEVIQGPSEKSSQS